MSSRSLGGVAEMVAAGRLPDIWGAGPAAPLRLRIHAGRRFNLPPTADPYPSASVTKAPQGLSLASH